MVAERTPPILVWGERWQSGVYLLHLQAERDLSVVFGRFLGGEPVRVAAGEYLYVGSAMGQRGSATLARRVLRHTSRGAGRPAHAIQKALLAALQGHGLGPADIKPPRQKKTHWHIDYLVGETAVSLRHIVMLRTGQRRETALARYLRRLPQTEILVTGLGARDDPGETHLLRLEGGAWGGIVTKVAAF